ncbi:MAG: SHOCT domain-containing protein [Bacillus sp. (in: firmicutes)]
MMNDMMMMNNNSMMIGMCIMMIIGIFLLIVLIGAVVYIVARLLMKNSRIYDRPLMILKERFAKGEINEEEYKQRKKFLTE